jgi:nucleotide-binding universal stress UspA family protein
VPHQEKVWETIVSFATDQAASLIVMGTHGRSGVRQALLGSVATSVMHNAGRPVAVVPESFVRAD